MTHVTAIVPSAGLGTRFGTSERKHFAKVSNKPLLFYTLQELHRISPVSEIIPVFRKEDMDRGREIVASGDFHKIKKIAEGGKERQDSVCNALNLIEDDMGFPRDDCLILIHDGVRPLASAGLVQRLLQEVKNVDGVIPGLLMKDTLKEVGTDGFVVTTVKRENFRSIQTPQVFSYTIIKKAYDSAHADGFYATDDAALVERVGGRIKIIEGEPFNIKVTTQEDMDFVRFKLESRKT
jgi:2-C-methyl-D-erythritol 4-phosphate cytidylyltransferase